MSNNLKDRFETINLKNNQLIHTYTYMYMRFKIIMNMINLQIQTDNSDGEEMPDYLPEEEEEDDKEGVVSLFTGLKQSASSLYKSTTEFLSNSFYW